MYCRVLVKIEYVSVCVCVVPIWCRLGDNRGIPAGAIDFHWKLSDPAESHISQNPKRLLHHSADSNYFFFFSISSRHPVQTEHPHRMWVLHLNTWLNDANVLNFQTVALFLSNSDIGENCSLFYCINAEMDFGRFFKAARFV